MVVKNRLEEIPRLHAMLAERANPLGLSPDVRHALELSLDELLTNTISYGFPEGGEHDIVVRLQVDGERVVTLEIEDDGRPFNPLERPAPDTAAPLDERPIGGLGIHLVKQLMDEVRYRRHGAHNIVTLTKRNDGKTHGDP